MKSHMRTAFAIFGLGALSAAAALGLAACESTPQLPEEFSDAHAVVEGAASRAEVVRYASPELERARDYLSRADARATGHGADAVARHYAYLAAQIARIAELRAQEQLARARIRANEQERERILRETRVAGERDRRGAELLDGLVRELHAARMPRGLVITLDDVRFEKGRANLPPGVASPVARIAKLLEELPERRVQIEAFTDNVGAQSYNLELSQSRADAVAMAFIHHGIDAARVRALGYGEWFAAPENARPANGPPDRRVEIIVSNDAGVIPALLPVVTSIAGAP